MKKLILKVLLPPFLFILLGVLLNQLLTQYVVTIVLFPIVTLFYLFIEKRDRDKNNARSGKTFKEKTKDFSKKLLIVLLSSVLVICVTYFLEPPTIKLSILSFLAIAILGPIEEELIYRGLSFKYADDLMGTMFGAFLSSMIFAAGHMDGPITMILSFATGFILCLILKKTKSIQYPILAHILINGVLLVL